MSSSSQQAAFEAWLSRHCDYDDLNKFEIELANEAWQAALESPDAQALRKDAERYLWLRAHWTRLRTTYHDNTLRFTIADAFCDLAEPDIDAAIDAAMEKQK